MAFRTAPLSSGRIVPRVRVPNYGHHSHGSTNKLWIVIYPVAENTRVGEGGGGQIAKHVSLLATTHTHTANTSGAKCPWKATIK